MEHEETITLTWSMDDDSWSHWAQGRGSQTVSAVVLEGLNEIRKSPEVRKEIKSCCERIREDQKSTVQNTQEGKHRIEIQLPSVDWGEAFQLVGTPGDPVNPSHLLAAVILESKTWKQSGNAAAEYNSGRNEDDLISSIAVSTKLTHTKRLELGRYETAMAILLVVATFIGAVATVFIARAEWITLCR